MAVKLSRDQRKWLKQGDHAVQFGEEMYSKGYKRSKRDTQRQVMTIMFLVLHDKFGFGKKRLETVLQEFNGQVDSFAYEPNKRDGITAEHMKQVLEDETGFKFFIAEDKSNEHD